MCPTRRGVLTGLAVVLAGCTAPADGDGEGSPTPTRAPASSEPAGSEPTARPTQATGTPIMTDDTTPAGELDLREANVTRVELSRSGDEVTFDVTLFHDDDGEDGYANWWQVERLDGTRIGRRELLHAHGTKPFTRSDTYDIPDDVTCVVVRGHDQTHGYGGQVGLVNLDSGEVSLVYQEGEKRAFDANECP
jgi:hypothetical protein